jgi:hypothetical protein
MKIKKLFEILALVDGVTSTNWKTVMEIVGNPILNIPGYFNNGIKSNNAVILSKQWHDSWKLKYPEHYPLDLSQLKTWSTYDNCAVMHFKNNDNKLYCQAMIYDGDNNYGYRTDLKFSAELILPNKFIKVLENLILNYFDEYLENEYETYLETQKKNWIDGLRNKLLNLKHV